ncbi:MAG TPA: endonuclease/exonuclease/phosphatase family protein [Actinopolymorphaceae bacterium]|nr:endonuclease/exonuclease/phosphatase family protein [Actinopolymorphaceae bacterium]
MSTPALTPVIGPAAAPRLHVMSFNLRVAHDGLPDPWTERRDAVAAILRTELPAVVGTQEGLYDQVQDVAADLPSTYEWIGTGRRGGSHGEFMAVFFDGERLTAREYDNFWLSDTPEVVGSASWGNAVVRMATWVRFADRATGGEFVLLNTHLDHAAESAQRLGAELVARRVAEFDSDLPVIVTGDFNVPAEASEPYDTLIGAGLVDTWSKAQERRTPVVATYHGYRPVRPDGARIDWILVRPGTEVVAAAINTTTVDGRWASDHWPVHALLELG